MRNDADDDGDDAALWSSERCSSTVSVDPSGARATKTGGEATFGYIESTEAVCEGVRTW